MRINYLQSYKASLSFILSIQQLYFNMVIDMLIWGMNSSETSGVGTHLQPERQCCCSTIIYISIYIY